MSRKSFKNSLVKGYKTLAAHGLVSGRRERLANSPVDFCSEPNE